MPRPSARVETLLVALLMVPVAACDRLPTEPAPVGGSAVALARGATLPAAVRHYAKNFLHRLPGVAKRVWSACLQDDKAKLVGTRYRGGVNCRLLQLDGYPRRFVVYVPPTLPADRETPVVLMHHGSTGSGEQYLDISGWAEEADAQGFVAVFPTGMEYLVLDSGRMSTKWHDFSLASKVDLSIRPPDYPSTSPWPARDSAFVALILDDLEAQLPVAVDSRRIYASGFSNGGGFVSRLAIELSDRLAAVGPFAGGLTEVHGPKQRIPVIYGWGTDDAGKIDQANAMLAEGQDSIEVLPLDPAELLALASVQVGIDAFTGSFDLDPFPSQIVRQPHATGIRWSTPLAGNADGNEFGMMVLEGVPHHYPHLGSPRRKNPYGFSAAQIFWQFFERHPKA